MSKTVRSIAPWFGSQAGINDLVVPELAGAKAFYDVCCGGCSLLLAKPPSPREIINDLHGGLVNVCRVLASPRRSLLQSQLASIVVCEDIHKEAWLYRKRNGYVVAPSIFEVRTAHVMAALYQVIEWWMGCGGHAGTKADPRMSKRYSQGGGAAGTRFRSFVGAVDTIGERLAGPDSRVEIQNVNLFDLLGKIKDEDGTVIYADPPFIAGGDEYEFAFERRPWVPEEQREGVLPGLEPERLTDDYDRLSEALDRFERAKVVVRHYPHPRIDELFPPGRWRRVTRDRNKATAQHGQGFDGERKEVTEQFLCKGVLL